MSEDVGEMILIARVEANLAAEGFPPATHRWELYWQEKLDPETDKRFYVTTDGMLKTWLSRQEAAAWRAKPGTEIVKSKRFPQGFVEPEWWAVEIDETADYAIDEEDRPFVERIWGVWYFDFRSHTHICSFEASYFMYRLSAYVQTKDDVPDEVRDRLDGRYCYEPCKDDYMSVPVIDRIDASHKKAFGPIDEDVADEAEFVREYWQGNSPF